MLRPMDESGFDTLKATRALEAAGFASGQAEAMVTVFGGAIVANVATKWDIRDLKDEIGALRTEFKRDIGTLRRDVDAKLEQQTGTLRSEFDARLSVLRTELRSEIVEVRLSVESLRATMYKLLLAQAAVIVGLILGLQQLL